ncbi:hypothetical protein HY489_06025 [Candidatus Woesearchaeota archaeon]|nr:hypothetical protein [Candidatus Woesearchaeota archaeon]
MSDKNGRNIGGFFLFPFKSVLSKDLLLDTDSIDNYEGAREVLLKHKSYLQGSPKLIARLLVLAQYHYPAWLKDYDFTKVFFEEAKSHIEELKKLSAFNRFLRHKVGSKWHFDFKLPNGEEQTIISGQGLFYEMLSKIDLESKGELEKLANFAAENNFLFFSLYLNFRRVSIYPSDGAFTPILATFKQSQAPLALSGTIFQQQNTYLWEEKAVESPNLGAQLLTLTLMKNQPNISQYGDARDYIAVMKKMSPVKVKQLFELTRTEIIKLLDSMVNQRFADCKVDVTRGVLFLNTAYTNIDTLNALVKLGVPIFCNFSNNGVFFINWELEFFIDQVLQPVKLNLPESYFVQKNQFYLKGDLVVMYNPEKGTIQKVAD